MRDQRLPPRAFLLTICLAAIWGGNPVAVKVGLADAPPLRLGWMRFVLGGAVVLAYASIRSQGLRVARHERGALLGLGALFSAQLAFMNIGQDHTSSGHAAVLMSSYPLWTAVFAHLFVPGDRLTARRALGALIAYAGVLVVFSASLGKGGPFSLRGDLLLMISAVLLGARQIVLSRSAQGIAIPKLLLAQALVGAGSFIAASLAFESEPTRWNPRLGLALFYQGIVIAGFAFLFQTWLLKNFAPSRVTTVYLTQPIFGVIFSWLVLGEPIGTELYLGAVLVAVGSYFVQQPA